MPHNDRSRVVNLRPRKDTPPTVPGWTAGARWILILIAASWLIPFAIAVLT